MAPPASGTPRRFCKSKSPGIQARALRHNQQQRDRSGGKPLRSAACAPGPQPPHTGGPPVPPGADAPQAVCSLAGPLARPFCALRGPCCAPFRCAVPLRRARPAPLRGPGPAFSARAALAGPAPRPRPPGSGARPLCALARSAGARWPRFAPWSASLRCGLPDRSPLLRFGLPPGSTRVPRRVPPVPSPSGLRGRLPPGRGPAPAFGGLVLASGPRPFGSRAVRLRPACGGGSSGGGSGSALPRPRPFPRLRCLSGPRRCGARLWLRSQRRGLLHVPWASPPSPPRPYAPAGGFGEPGARWGFAPLWGALLAPLSRAPGALRARPGAAFSAR